MESIYTYDVLYTFEQVINTVLSDQVLIPSFFISLSVCLFLLILYFGFKFIDWLFYCKETTKEERREHREARKKRMFWRAKE